MRRGTVALGKTELAHLPTHLTYHPSHRPCPSHTHPRAASLPHPAAASSPSHALGERPQLSNGGSGERRRPRRVATLADLA
jgi:hypothetical protein